jgi:hypothetical protein
MATAEDHVEKLAAAGVPDRDAVVAILAAQADRPAGEMPERIDSLGVAWLVYEAERCFGIALDLTDELLASMSTVTGAVRVLREAQRKTGRDG